MLSQSNAMGHDRISRLSIGGYKSLADVTLELDGLTVLIGANGSGKSALLECLRFLSRAPRSDVHLKDWLEREYGPLHTLLHRKADAITMTVVVSGEGVDLQYRFAIGMKGNFPVVLHEYLHEMDSTGTPIENEEQALLSRSGEQMRYRVAEAGAEHRTEGIGAQALALGWVRFAPGSQLDRVRNALATVEVHPPFDVRPTWQQVALGVKDGPRWPAQLEKADRLEMFGTNLAAVYYHLRNGTEVPWSDVLDQLRLGLGDDLRDLRLPVASRGRIELELVFGADPDRPVAADRLSEGQLAYLCFVALCALGPAGLVAIDEPELHLHPALVARVAWMLEELAMDAPVVIATHSNQLLDALGPDARVVLCDLDERRATRLRTPKPEQLKVWLAEFEGLGRIRQAGYERQLFDSAAAEE